jgi:hypothetical protein
VKQSGKSGTRIGDWFLWIDVEAVKTGDYRTIPLVTLRRAITGGEVLATVVGSNAMAAELRAAADRIDAAVDEIHQVAERAS